MWKVLQFDENTDPGPDGEGLAKIWVEIDEKGLISREIGFAADGTIRHKYPGDGPYGRYGVFDLVCFEPSTPADISPDRFERSWDQPRIPWEAEGEPSGLFGKFVDWVSKRRDNRTG